MLTFSNDDIKAKIKADLGEGAAAEAASIDFLPFPDLEQSVRDDVAIVRASKIVDTQIPITGYIYDVKVCGCWWRQSEVRCGVLVQFPSVHLYSHGLGHVNTWRLLFLILTLYAIAALAVNATAAAAR